MCKQHLGTSREVLKWFEIYLTDCQQSTRVGISLSDPLTVTHGVPQGSILGPMLFSLYMNDLPSVVKFSCVESYVDDTKIYLSFSTKDLDTCMTQVIEDLRNIARWCCTNSLLINPIKTKFIHWGPAVSAKGGRHSYILLKPRTCAWALCNGLGHTIRFQLIVQWTHGIISVHAVRYLMQIRHLFSRSVLLTMAMSFFWSMALKMSSVTSKLKDSVEWNFRLPLLCWVSLLFRVR